MRCPKFSGHVFYDGTAIYVCNQDCFTSLALQIFESASYTHCSVFKYLSKSQPISLNMRWHLCRDEFPCWFFYPIQVYEDHLSIFTVGTLQSSARMASVLFKGRLKKNIVVALTGRVLGLHDRLTTMMCNELFCELCAKSDTDFLPSLLSAYFQTVFGGDVATALQKPLCPVYSLDISMLQLPEWATVLFDDLVPWLSTLPFDRIVECIQKLPAMDRPSINSHSHRKTISGLVGHILERVRYLTSIPVLMLCDIMEYCIPHESFLEYQDMPEPECIACILELEYDRDIILALARPKLSCIETQKIQRCVNKVLVVANRRQELTDLCDKWPEMVPPCCAPPQHVNFLD